MFRRRTRALQGLGVALVCLLSACSPASNGSADGGDPGKPAVALFIPGQLGDGGFFDNSQTGVKEAGVRLGLKVRTVETGPDPSKWAPALNDVAGGDDQVIIVGTYGMKQIVEQAAQAHPEKSFVLYDVESTPAECGCHNIYSILYRYSESGFLAGALAGLLHKAGGVERIGSGNTVGVIGGQDIPVIQDYINGFKAGVAQTNPSLKVLSGYAGSFADPVKGQNLAAQMISDGADVLFTAAGGTDKGVIQAAAEHDVWAIGNSLTQADDPMVNGKTAVLTSAVTSVDTSLADAVEKAAAGTLPLGTTVRFGAKQKTNYVAQSQPYLKYVPEPVRGEIEKITTEMADGRYDSVLDR
ncbi:BMP family lipoprotein [Microbispora siamensis]|uniref:BMP family ABC transporter substrate-binding protein n=1 Tax=Microbispora siamensis TaxID=564413 RepID=A0ABQ4GRY1_9ACTN|nr:BMP family ABC transporter substrate-binding protein [Microbispora siamensis]GIH64124.1 BMP family ABC transporter substrate-binding protein [Microbispora siamensis]